MYVYVFDSIYIAVNNIRTRMLECRKRAHRSERDMDMKQYYMKMLYKQRYTYISIRSLLEGIVLFFPFLFFLLLSSSSTIKLTKIKIKIGQYIKLDPTHNRYSYVYKIYFYMSKRNLKNKHILYKSQCPFNLFVHLINCDIL